MSAPAAGALQPGRRQTSRVCTNGMLAAAWLDGGVPVPSLARVSM